MKINKRDNFESYNFIKMDHYIFSFFSNISYSNEESSDVCTFQSSAIEKNEKKCIYECNN